MRGREGAEEGVGRPGARWYDAGMTSASLTRPVLVLDAGFQPVNVVSLKRAVALVCTGKAVVLQAEAGLVLRAEKLLLECPRVIRLAVSVAHRVYRAFHLKLNRRNLLARDGWRCQYCGASELPLTIDHVVPRSRFPAGLTGQADTWENCVAACFACNVRKGNRTPEEAGMPLSSEPSRPRWSLSLIARRRWPEYVVATWQPYLRPATLLKMPTAF